jgi:hypothetical protein
MLDPDATRFPKVRKSGKVCRRDQIVKSFLGGGKGKKKRGVRLCKDQFRKVLLALRALSLEYASILTPMKTSSYPPRIVSC